MTQNQSVALTLANEITTVLEQVREDEIQAAVDAISQAKKIVVIGVGREGLSARGFAMRLAHLGLNSPWGWDDTAPNLGPGDVLIMVNGSGCIGHLDYIFQKVHQAGAKSVVVTGVPGEHTPRQADVCVWVPATVYGGKGDLVPSIQPMGSLFEQCTWIVFDVMILVLSQKLNQSFAQMAARHRNFE